RGASRLSGAGLRIAREAGLRSLDLEVHGHGQLDTDRVALVARPIEGHPLLEVVDRLVELVRPEMELLVGVGLHEMEIVPVPEDVLHGPPLELCAGPLRTRLERALDRLTALDIA